LRRYYVEGGSYFFTLVSHNRRPIFCDTAFRAALRSSIEHVREQHPFCIVAWVLLPDHLHCIWSLPQDDAKYSIRWSLIKRSVSFQLRDSDWFRETGQLWQNRFREHYIRDEADLEKHFDYVHFNPVKHDFVENPVDWEWSTYHQYAKIGYYTDIKGPKDVDMDRE